MVVVVECGTTAAAAAVAAAATADTTVCYQALFFRRVAVGRIIINLMDQTIRQRSRVVDIVTRTEEEEAVAAVAVDRVDKCNLRV